MNQLLPSTYSRFEGGIVRRPNRLRAAVSPPGTSNLVKVLHQHQVAARVVELREEEEPAIRGD
jgi:hypothetical protein